MTNTDFKAKNYLTTFHVGQDGQGNWKAWKEFNGKVQEERYCLNWKHASRTRTHMISKFWNWRLS